jgi:hypothetical protein
MQPRLIAVLVTFLATACASWSPEPSDFPVKVDVGSGLSDAQRQALLGGIDMLEARVGADVFTPVESNGRAIQRGRIAVRSGSLEAENGWYDRNHWACRITLGRDDTMYPGVAVHELLHCLGLDHEADEDSIMAEYNDAQSKLLLSHVNHVRALMGLPALPEESGPVSSEPEAAPVFPADFVLLGS